MPDFPYGRQHAVRPAVSPQPLLCPQPDALPAAVIAHGIDKHIPLTSVQLLHLLAFKEIKPVESPEIQLPVHLLHGIYPQIVASVVCDLDIGDFTVLRIIAHYPGVVSRIDLPLEAAYRAHDSVQVFRQSVAGIFPLAYVVKKHAAVRPEPQHVPGQSRALDLHKLVIAWTVARIYSEPVIGIQPLVCAQPYQTCGILDHVVDHSCDTGSHFHS